MATKQAAELRNLDTDELESRLVETKAELFNLRFKHVTGELPNMARLGDLRREVARILTLLREREIAEYEASQDLGAGNG
ncbi:MAG: 50S ribosomal protein L29 [Actinobacteria bacterium]|nr:50S ribosomal protein L29 [Actinomycetota bacterium]